VGPVQIPQGRARTHSVNCVFLHPVGSTGHVLHFMRPRPKKLTHYFLCSGGTGRIPQKARRETLHQTCFLHAVGSMGAVVHSCLSGT
jgi:hypothetical protein